MNDSRWDSAGRSGTPRSQEAIIKAVLEREALRQLTGLGDAAQGEWREMGDRAYHVRRRLSAREMGGDRARDRYPGNAGSIAPGRLRSAACCGSPRLKYSLKNLEEHS